MKRAPTTYQRALSAAGFAFRVKRRDGWNADVQRINRAGLATTIYTFADFTVAFRAARDWTLSALDTNGDMPNVGAWVTAELADIQDSTW